MFSYYDNLSKLYLSLFNTKNATNKSYMFYNFQNLFKINLFFFKYKYVIYIKEMFSNCTTLFNSKNVIDMIHMFLFEIIFI